MTANTKIEWAHDTHNEWTGCTKISQGCRNCYAEALGKRAGRHPKGYVKGSPRLLTSEANRRKPFKWDREAREAGVRRRVFTNSLADVFDEEVPDAWRDTLFSRMALTPSLDWLVLTKRAEKMRAYVTDPGLHERLGLAAYDVVAKHERKGTPGVLIAAVVAKVTRYWPLPNVWLGVSVEDQETADKRIPLLLATPAAKRFISLEPMLGAVDVTRWLRCEACGYSSADKALHGDHRLCGALSSTLDLVIVGGESGPGARPCDVAWIRSVVGQCKAASVPVFVKQLGALPIENHGGIGVDVDRYRLRDPKGGSMEEWPEDLRIRELPS